MLPVSGLGAPGLGTDRLICQLSFSQIIKSSLHLNTDLKCRFTIVIEVIVSSNLADKIIN